MQNKKKFNFYLIAIIGVLVMSGCRKLPATTSSTTDDESMTTSFTSEETTTGGDSTDTTSGDDPVDPFALLDAALDADYSNLTIGVTSFFNNGYDSEFYMEKIVNGFTIIPDALYGDLIYCDYEGESYLYFEDNYGHGDAWLKEGYHNLPLGLENTYFSLYVLLRELRATDKILYNAPLDLYYINDVATMAAFDLSIFGTCWDNIIDFMAFSVTGGYLGDIIGFDARSEDDGVIIEFADIGSTSYYGELPPQPNAENVRTYAEYTGTEPWIEKIVTNVTISLPQGHTGHLDYEETVRLEKTFLPEDANTGTSLDWYSSDPDIASVSVTGLVTAHKEGTVEIYARTAYVSEGDKVWSNRITIVVDPLPTPDEEGLVADFTFNSMTGTAINVTNNVVDGFDATVSANTSAAVSVSTSNYADSDENKWPKGTNVLVLNPSEAIVNFDFGDELVTGLSFYYSLFWESDFSNIEYLTEFKIQTSTDGVIWTDAVDLLPQFKATVSKVSITLVEATFAPTSLVRIYAKNTFSGRATRIGFSSISFYSNITAPLAVNEQMVGTWIGEDIIYFEDMELVINEDSTAVVSNYEGIFNLTLVEAEDDEYIFEDEDGYEFYLEFDEAEDEIYLEQDDFGYYAYLERYVAPVIIDVTSISLVAVGSTTLDIGSKGKVSATVNPSNATDKTVTYHSSNTAVITVDASGNVTAVGAGTATVTAKSANGLVTSNAVTFTVNAPSAELEGSPILGTWEGYWYDGYGEFELTITADGKMRIRYDFTNYDFTFESEDSGVYTFTSASGDKITVWICDDCGGLSLEWEAEDVYFIEDYYGCLE